MPTAVNVWNKSVLAKVETVFGTAEAPVSSAGLEVIEIDMGPVEKPEVRAKKDKTAGRDNTLEFVEGRVSTIPFSIDTSVKSRATATTAMKESAILRAAGLIETVGGSDVTYGLSSDPTPVGLTVHAASGTGTGTRLAEVGRGGVIESLEFSGGDKELTLKASGRFVGKTHLGYAVVTFADGVTTTFSFATAADAYRFEPGYYKVENEVVLVTAVNYGAGTGTATRAQLTTTAAAHAAQPMYGYVATPTVSGSPISEALDSVTLDGVAVRALNWSVRMQTGMKHLPHGSGSAYAPGAFATRVSTSAQLRLALTDEEVAWLGKATERKSVALSIVAGTTAGGIFTFSMPYCELEAPRIPDPANDLAIVDLALMVRGSAGNDSFALVCS